METKDYLELLKEQQGMGQPRARTGGSTACACPNKNCKNYSRPLPKTRGEPCNQTKCRICGTPLSGVGTTGSKIPSGK